MNTILVIFLCIFSVHGFNDTIERKERESAGVRSADLLVQRITTSLGNIHHIFWLEAEKTLFCTDKEADTSFQWNYGTSKVDKRYFKEIGGEMFAFEIPIKNNNKKGIIASDNNLRMISYDNRRVSYNISEPVFMFKEQGYNIHTAHCDKDGNMYIVICFKLISKDPKKGSIMYRFKNMVPEKIKHFETKVADFAFSSDYKKMFVICSMGELVTQYNFNMGTGALSNPKHIFNITANSAGMKCKMTSIEIDNEENFWISTDDSYVLRVAKNGTLTKIVETPFCGLTHITFGGFESKNLLVASKKECSPLQQQAGSVLAISGLHTKGIADIPVAWN